MSKYLIKFDVRDIISYYDYKKIIFELSKWYQKQYKNVSMQYEGLLNTRDFDKVFDIIKYHKNIVVDLIKKLIDKFDFDNQKIGIYLSNSFARGTNLIDSDIDLNFMYEDFSEGKKYEELISHALFEITSKYRDFIHDSISHRLPREDIDIEDDDEVIYEIIFSDGKIQDKITKGNEKLMLKLYNSYKDINSFTKYYTERINSYNIDEWLYFQTRIYSSPNYLDSLFSYICLLESSTAHLKFNVYKTSLMKEISDTLKQLDAFNTNDMAEFKRFFKNVIYKYIYETLIILKKERIIDGEKYLFKSVEELLSLLESGSRDIVKKYFGNIMLFNFICDKYGIEFRTRYHHEMSDDFHKFCKDKLNIEGNLIETFKGLARELLKGLLAELKNSKDCNYVCKNYNPKHEQINIDNYSPLSYINNVSKVYQHDAFLMPYIEINGKTIPIHPDMLDDLNISRDEVVKYELVYPTSSFRTVYSSDKNVCYKLPLLRQITRSIRNMPNKELRRSEIAQEELSKHSFSKFTYLNEKCVYGEKEIYNYIIREMPKKKIYPWFYCIVSGSFSKEFMIECIENMVKIWMYYASLGIYFESAHTQNFLVDDEANIYYRDLSDIRILEYDIMTPSYINELKSKGEMHSIFFDRSICEQNIEHFIRYCEDITEEDIEYIKSVINREIEKYNMEFPNYSMNYDKNREGHHPINTKLVRLRNY